MGEQPAKGLEDAAVELFVMALVEELPQQRHAEDQSRGLHLAVGEVFAQRVEGADVADEHHPPDRVDQVDPGQEVGILRAALVAEVVHRHLHDLADRALGAAGRRGHQLKGLT